MGRPIRYHLKNSIHHVMLRGNFKEIIFTEKSDYLFFYSLLSKAIEKFQCKIHLFCLMTNHVHLLIEVCDIPLGKFMQSITSRYSNYFNKKQNRIGHLFQGRYLSKHVSNEQYLSELIYYIHANPLSANMVEELDSYLWSSHRHYKKLETISWLTSDAIENHLIHQLNYIDNPYFQFITTWKSHPRKELICNFDKNNLLTISSISNLLNQSQSSLSLTGVSIEMLSVAVSQFLGIPYEKIISCSLNRKIILARPLISYFSHYHAGHFIKTIAEFFDKHPRSISLSINKMISNSCNAKLRTELQYYLKKMAQEKTFWD